MDVLMIILAVGLVLLKLREDTKHNNRIVLKKKGTMVIPPDVESMLTR